MYEYDIQPLVPSEVFSAAPGETAEFYVDATPTDETVGQWNLDSEFEQLFRQSAQEPQPQPQLAEHLPVPPRVDRRRRRSRLAGLRDPRVLSLVIAGITAAVATVVSGLGALISYDPLRLLAFPTAHSLAGLWPLLVYGPWLVSCLSILHAAVHRRQVKVAWITLILFSGVTVALCIAHAPRTLTAISTAGLPPVSALVSFHLLVGQITLLDPRHAKTKLPRQRKH